MKHRVFIGGVLILAACAGVGFRSATGSTPESTVRAFAAAIERADMKAAARLVKGGKPNADYSVFVRQFNKGFKVVLSDMKTKMGTQRASVRYNVKVSAGREQGTAAPETLQLQMVGKSWLIVPPADPGHGLILGAVAAMTVNPQKVLREAKASAQATVCISNVKQLCMGFLMLSADNDDILKAKPGSWKSAVKPYLRNNEQFFHCPADSSGSVSYSVNTAVLGKSTTAVDDPSATVLVYEGKNGVLKFRHRDRAAVGYCDGHVKMVNREQAKKLRWKP